MPLFMFICFRVSFQIFYCIVFCVLNAIFIGVSSKYFVIFFISFPTEAKVEHFFALGTGVFVQFVQDRMYSDSVYVAFIAV
jgi:hypothetical protein